jgi:cytochrome c-type biogenesis protein CcmH
VLGAKVMRRGEELRGLVCQNETSAASHADRAVDLRKQIRQKLQQGQSQEQILDFMVQRYGDFVLYRPPVKSSTWLLWGGPFLLLGVALAGLVLNIRRRRTPASAPLQGDEAERLRRLLGEEKS